MTYGYSLRWVAGRTALYVEKLLRGAKPADTPVEQLTKFELVIDMSMAREVDLKIPETLLYRADAVLR
jgi:putative ABC transport system substrate-binding protein